MVSDGGALVFVDKTAPTFSSPAPVVPQQQQQQRQQQQRRQRQQPAAAVAAAAAAAGVGGDPADFVDVAGARRLAAVYDVELDTALEVMSLVRNDEKLAGRLLATVARGVSPSLTLPVTPTAGVSGDQQAQFRRPLELSAASSAVWREALLFHLYCSPHHEADLKPSILYLLS